LNLVGLNMEVSHKVVLYSIRQLLFNSSCNLQREIVKQLKGGVRRLPKVKVNDDLSNLAGER
jgi:hypothetical protein